MKMMAGTFASRILGLVREMVTAALFGATRQLDAFYVAYTLSNLLRQLLAEGALSASFVPVFSRTLAEKGAADAKNLVRQAMTVLIVAASVVVLIGIAVAPLLVGIIAPGFDVGERVLAIALTRVMFPFLILVSVGALAMGVLNSMGSFFIPAIAPALSNAAYILFLLATMKRVTVWNLAFAVLIGGACQMVLQLIWCSKIKMPLVPAVPKKDNGELRTMMTLFLPYAAGLSLNQVTPVINRMLGSFLRGGAISVLNYADRVLQLPLGLFVIAISQAVLPMLSKLDPNDKPGFRDFIRDAMRFNMFIVLPVAAGLFAISSELVHLLFFRGAFNEWAWGATATALSLYALGLPGMAGNTVLMRALYARRMPKAAIQVTAATVLVNVCVSLLLIKPFAYAGLAAASATAFTVAALFGGYKLSRSIGLQLEIFDPRWLCKIIVSTALMAGFVFAFKHFKPYPISSGAFVRLFWLLALIAAAAVVYGAATAFARCPEWKWVKEALLRRR